MNPILVFIVRLLLILLAYTFVGLVGHLNFHRPPKWIRENRGGVHSADHIDGITE